MAEVVCAGSARCAPFLRNPLRKGLKPRQRLRSALSLNKKGKERPFLFKLLGLSARV
jgi:hypothetical protein